MPWLPMYIDKSDLKVLIDWLNEEKNIAFIIGDGLKRWKAVNSIERYDDIRHCLWHCESGSLPLLRKKLPDGKISDPFKGWKEKRTGADPKVPYFGAGHPGVYWLNARTESTYNSDHLGLSSFEWIGNWYKAIGIEAHPATKKWWERLKRWVKSRPSEFQEMDRGMELIQKFGLSLLHWIRLRVAKRETIIHRTANKANEADAKNLAAY